jgi:hypothetical protein
MLERMTVGFEGDPSLAALLMWCLFFALEEGGHIYGLHVRGGRCIKEPRMARVCKKHTKM